MNIETTLLRGASPFFALLFALFVNAAAAQSPMFPGQKGGEDIFGQYEPVAGWPKPLSQLPGHERWTYGSGEGVFAESPNRVFILMRGELPVIETPPMKYRPEIGPSIIFPAFRLPIRDATISSPPGGGAAGDVVPDGIKAWEDAGGRLGVDARWEHCILVVDAEGNITEDWTQWDSMLSRPHAIYESPYDPEKHVWLVDDYRHAIFKFTNDGKKLVQTIGTFGEPGADDKHFNRPTFIDWLPDGTFFVADGYNGTRVVKFDKDGKYLTSWGQKSDRDNDTRPGYFNNVHGIAVDPETRRVFVNDRYNHRVQVFDENGKFLDQWRFADSPSDIHLFIITADRYLWAADRGTNKILKYDLDGNFLYSWGTWGTFPGGMWGVHGMSVDREGNFYVAEVDRGGAQKFRPRRDANPDLIVGKPVYPAWQ
jgi:DNA-binding beta-propeller fold protein YncE